MHSLVSYLPASGPETEKDSKFLVWEVFGCRHITNA